MMFAFERQKKVVFPLDLRAETPRTIAGCYSVREQRASAAFSCLVLTKGMMRRASSICSRVPPSSCSSLRVIALGPSGDRQR